MHVHSIRGAASLIALLLCCSALGAAALDPAYLDELPDPQRVISDFQGPDRLDTLALQVAALTRLNRLVNEMAGDRYYTPGKFPTPDEARIIAAIRAASGPLSAEAEATFDPQARGANSPRTQWKNQVRKYETSDTLYEQLMKQYFTPAFREAHAAKLAVKARSQEKVRADMARGQRALEGKPEPIVVPSKIPGLLTGAAMLLVMLVGSARLIREPVISANAPYRFRVGLKRYTLESVTGVIANYTHREVERNVEVGDPDRLGRITTEAYEAFTIDRPGASQPIHLATYRPDIDLCVFLEQVGQRMTVWWFVHGGGRYYVLFQGERGLQPHKVTMGALDQLFPLPGWTAVPAIVFGIAIGGMVIASELSGIVAVFAAPMIWIGILKLLKSRAHARFYRNQFVPLAKRWHAPAD